MQKDLFYFNFFFFFEGLRNVLQFLTVFKCDVYLYAFIFFKNVWHFFYNRIMIWHIIIIVSAVSFKPGETATRTYYL